MASTDSGTITQLVRVVTPIRYSPEQRRVGNCARCRRTATKRVTLAEVNGRLPWKVWLSCDGCAPEQGIV